MSSIVSLKPMESIDSIISALTPDLGKPGRSTFRACSQSEVVRCITETMQAKQRVRVYSPLGFVPNSYKWHCEIQYVEATSTEAGWQFRVGSCSAQRSQGNGSLVVVQ